MHTFSLVPVAGLAVLKSYSAIPSNWNNSLFLFTLNRTSSSVSMYESKSIYWSSGEYEKVMLMCFPGKW